MSISTTTYVRKPIYVDAVQVTEENFEAIAEWCGGAIKETMSLRNRPVKYIHVPVTRPQTERQEQGRVGDWILTSERGYKVYTPKAFSVAFDKVNDAPTQVYPHPDGDYMILGPEVFAGTGGNSNAPDDHDTVCWKGENFYTIERAKELLDFVPLSERTIHPEQQSFAGPIVPMTDEQIVEQRRELEALVRQQAADGKITAEEAEMQIARFPVLEVHPVGTGPMPKQPLPDVDPSTTPDANINPDTGLERPKAADVWAQVERGEITADRARELLGLGPLAEEGLVTLAEQKEKRPPTPEYLCNQCRQAKPRESVGDFCVDCGGQIVSRDDVLSTQSIEQNREQLRAGLAAGVITEQTPATVVDVAPVGMQPMPEQPEPTDVEERERPVPVPANMQTGREIQNAKLEHVAIVPATPENIAAGTIPIPEQVEVQSVTPEEWEQDRLRHEATQGQPYHPADAIIHGEEAVAGDPDQYTATQGAAPVSTPEDPSTHVGVDLEQDEALKASIDLTDENTLKAADEDEQLTADAMTED